GEPFGKGSTYDSGAGARVAGIERAKDEDGNHLPAASRGEEFVTAPRDIALSASDDQLKLGRSARAAVHSNGHPNAEITRVQRRLLLNGQSGWVGEYHSPQRKNEDDDHGKDSATHFRS